MCSISPLPLAKAVGRQHPTRYLAAVMSIIVGATMAHSLVPPTRGPLLVAAAMNINLGNDDARWAGGRWTRRQRWLELRPAMQSLVAARRGASVCFHNSNCRRKDSTPDTHEGVTAASDAGVEPEHRIPLGLADSPSQYRYACWEPLRSARVCPWKSQTRLPFNWPKSGWQASTTEA